MALAFALRLWGPGDEHRTRLGEASLPRQSVMA